MFFIDGIYAELSLSRESYSYLHHTADVTGSAIETKCTTLSSHLIAGTLWNLALVVPPGGVGIENLRLHCLHGSIGVVIEDGHKSEQVDQYVGQGWPPRAFVVLPLYGANTSNFPLEF